MRLKTLIILACLSMCVINAQKKPVDYRYKNGEKGLLEFLAKSIQYPENSFKNKSIGYSITELSISPSGEISHIKTINPIDDQIDAEIIRVLRQTKNKWKQDDTLTEDQNFYIQVAFIISGFQQNHKLTNPVHRSSFLEPIVITAMNFKNDPAMLPESDEIIIGKSSEHLKNNELKEALVLVSELIKRNPFNKDLYQLRMGIYKRINRSELIDNDIKKVMAFADGCSLDQLLNTENQ